MNWLYFLLALGLSALAFIIGAGVGYNYGMTDQVPEAQALLDKAEAERRRARNLTVSARRAAGEL